MKKNKIIQVICLAFVVVAACALTSCNVTRTVATESSYIQKGDTTTTIKVKTVETYDASKKLPRL